MQRNCNMNTLYEAICLDLNQLYCKLKEKLPKKFASESKKV
jgi:CRISPR/Cas system CSM-associated protein Csm4 (group 5 of RAMP superfamily)